jgi:hypothetical protein
MKRGVTGVLILLIFTLPLTAHSGSAAAQEGPWRVESPVRLSEVLKRFEPTAFRQVFIAPDGRQVAYEKRQNNQLCVLNIAQQQERCVTLAPELGYSFPLNDFLPPMRWSPDGTQIAVVGVPLLYFRDTDLGLVDLGTPEPTFTNLSDDGYSGTIMPGKVDLAVTLESYPAFSPDNTQIAVERTGIGVDGRFAPSALSIFDRASGEVRELGRLPGHEVYEVDAGTVAGLDWSPDGTTLAVSLRHQKLDPDYDGIWLVSVESGEWTHLATVETAQRAMQTVYEAPAPIFALAPVRWSPDGSRLLFWLGDSGSYNGQVWAFWLNLDKSSITAVPLPVSPNDHPDWRINWPRQAVWSPDGSRLLVAARMEIPPAAGDAVPLVDSGEALATALYMLDVNTGESMLLGHLPQEVTPFFTAAWGPDGDVIAGGYYLRLAHE